MDQEENVWRSLPFFAATFALQLAALAQVRDWLTGAVAPYLIVASGLLGMAGAITVGAIVCLAFSVWPADFRYAARERVFADYVETVRASISPGGGLTADAASEQPLRIVKSALVVQYGNAAENNRAINQRRTRWRTRAGLPPLVRCCAFWRLSP